jgi:hypothetical protein
VVVVEEYEDPPLKESDKEDKTGVNFASAFTGDGHVSSTPDTTVA